MVNKEKEIRLKEEITKILYKDVFNYENLDEISVSKIKEYTVRDIDLYIRGKKITIQNAPHVKKENNLYIDVNIMALTEELIEVKYRNELPDEIDFNEFVFGNA